MPPAKQYKITGETNYIYAPLAHRLGLFRIKTELENLCFKYEHPETYFLIEKLAVDRSPQSVFKEFSGPIRRKMGEMGYEFFWKERIKSVYSIWNKMSTKTSLSKKFTIYWRCALFLKQNQGWAKRDQCWMLYSSLTEIYKPHPERIRDWVSNPKANGYEALHVTVMGPFGRWVEIQIRSERMNDIAEKGLVRTGNIKQANQTSRRNSING